MPAAARRIDELPIGFGAGAQTRTEDLLITNQLLYQLSYAGEAGRPTRKAPRRTNDLSTSKMRFCRRPTLANPSDRATQRPDYLFGSAERSQVMRSRFHFAQSRRGVGRCVGQE